MIRLCVLRNNEMILYDSEGGKGSNDETSLDMYALSIFLINVPYNHWCPGGAGIYSNFRLDETSYGSMITNKWEREMTAYQKAEAWRERM